MVSVVIPAYNAADHIARALDSVLAQTHRPDEIIVVDDGSTDNTAAVVKRYGPAVRYIRQENAGASAARNTAIKAAASDWIAFLDCDDEWLPEKLELQLALLDRNKDLVWTCSNFYHYAYWQGRRVPHLEPEKGQALLAGKECFDSYFTAYTVGALGWTGTMIVRRDVLQETGLFNIGQAIGEDLDMWWRITYRWPKIGYISRPLAVYHMCVTGSLMRKHKQNSMIICDLIDRHLKLSAERNQLDQFKPAALHLLKWWMRNSLFDNRVYDLGKMVARFDKLLPSRFKAVMQLLSIFPKATMFCCRMISRTMVLLNVRRHIIRPPDRT